MLNTQLIPEVNILNKAGETFTAGHIHVTARQAVAQGLFAGPPTTARHTHIKTAIRIDAALATALCTSPAN